MEQKHAKYRKLLERCAQLAPVSTAVAHPCDESSLRGAVEAAVQGLIKPRRAGSVTASSWTCPAWAG